MQALELSSAPDLLILVTVVCILLYLRMTRHKTYWKKQDIPHEEQSLFFGALQYIIKPFHLVDQELYRKHGRIFGTFEDGMPTLYIAEPELVKSILIKEFAHTDRKVMTFNDPYMSNMLTVVPTKQWKKIRAVMTPAFTTSKLRKMHSLFQDSVKILVDQLKDAGGKKLDVDLTRFYSACTADIIARSTFGIELNYNSKDVMDVITSSENALHSQITVSVILKAFFQTFMTTLRKNVFDPALFDYYRQILTDVLRKREQTNEVQDDFLQMLMKARNFSKHTTCAKEPSIMPEDAAYNKSTGQGLSEEEVLAQCALLFLAGPEATSALVAYASYFLALNPRVQAKLRDESDMCFEQQGTSPSYDNVSKLKYLDAVVSETMRICPPFTRLERFSCDDYIIENTGIQVKKDSSIIIPVYAMHHDPEYFPEPFLFKPERFLEESGSPIRPYTYLPFGEGPRRCIGTKFATHAAKVILLHAVHNVQFVQTSRTKVPLEFNPGYGQLNPKDVTIGIRNRT